MHWKLLSSSVIATIAASLVVAGCGGDADLGAASTTTGTPAATAKSGGRKATLAESPSGIEPAGRHRGPEIVVNPPQGPPPKKLVVRDLREGDGEEAHTGNKVTIQFTAIRFNGEPFESSWEFGSPFRFELGAEKVSPGWEEGIPGMKVGGRRELVVPWTMTSQFSPLPGASPEDAHVYVLDLLDAR